MEIPLVVLNSPESDKDHETLVTVWYDEGTKDVEIYKAGDTPVVNNVFAVTPGYKKETILKKESTLQAARPIPLENFYDTKIQRVISKPTIHLLPDRLEAVGNGQDIITVTVKVVDYKGKEVKWDRIKVKSLNGKLPDGGDIPGTAQLSTEIVEFNNPVFRVKSNQRGKTTIKAKYLWEEGVSPRRANGMPSFPLVDGEVSITFTNPGF